LFWRKLAVATMTASCGGSIVTTSGDAGNDDGAENISDAGWTQCSSPEGYEVCGGTNSCNVGCVCNAQTTPNGLGVCVTGPSPYSGVDCTPGLDGHVCSSMKTADGSVFWVDTAYDFGVLLAQNGGAASVRYADLSLWTGDPLPTTMNCPNVGAAVCGAGCGDCTGGWTCVGRSPIHPIGVCDPDQSSPCGANPSVDTLCPAPNGCFSFTVQASAQSDANIAGICLPIVQCNALAQSLPGGGSCIPGQ